MCFITEVTTEGKASDNFTKQLSTLGGLVVIRSRKKAADTLGVGSNVGEGPDVPVRFD